MESKTSITPEEEKLKAVVSNFLVLVERVKGQGRHLADLNTAQLKLRNAWADFTNDSLELLNRQYLVYAELKPFTLHEETCFWTRLKKSMPREHHPQVDQVYELLKSYVAPVASKFQ